MSRKISREQAFKILFAIDIGENTIDQASEIVVTEPLEEEQKNFILREVEGVLKHQDTLDKIINKYSSEWDVNRLPATDRSILRLSLYEILFCEDIPISVSINEAVEMAKKYCDSKSYKFINGLLGSAVKEVNHH